MSNKRGSLMYSVQLPVKSNMADLRQKFRFLMVYFINIINITDMLMAQPFCTLIMTGWCIIYRWWFMQSRRTPRGTGAHRSTRQREHSRRIRQRCRSRSGDDRRAGQRSTCRRCEHRHGPPCVRSRCCCSRPSRHTPRCTGHQPTR